MRVSGSLLVGLGRRKFIECFAVAVDARRVNGNQSAGEECANRIFHGLSRCAEGNGQLKLGCQSVEGEVVNYSDFELRFLHSIGKEKTTSPCSTRAGKG